MSNSLTLGRLMQRYNCPENQNGYSTEQRRRRPVQEDLYQSRTALRRRPDSDFYISTGDFRMSRSECEKFLQQIRRNLNDFQNSLNFSADKAMRQLHEQFHRRHERIRKDILDSLQRAFNENQKHIRDELNRQRSVDPPQFGKVYKKIIALEDEITVLLTKLKGSDYKKAISKVVEKDFNLELQEMRKDIEAAVDHYIGTLGQIEPDQTRIKCIKDDLSKFFFLSKRKKNYGCDWCLNRQETFNDPRKDRSVEMSPLRQKKFFVF